MLKVRLLDLAKDYDVTVEWLVLLIENMLEDFEIDVKLDEDGLVIVCDEKASRHLIERIEATRLD